MVLLGTAFVPTSSPLCPCTPLLPFLLLLLEPSHPSVQKRPADYFAEMLKTDDHMAKIRDVMLKDQEKIERAERNKKTREMKKFGKQVRACMCVRVRCGFLFLRLWSCCAALECHHGFDDLHESRLTTLSLTHSHTHTHTLTHSLSLCFSQVQQEVLQERQKRKKAAMQMAARHGKCKRLFLCIDCLGEEGCC